MKSRHRKLTDVEKLCITMALVGVFTAWVVRMAMR
jgi:hypothetical protein